MPGSTDEPTAICDPNGSVTATRHETHLRARERESQFLRRQFRLIEIRRQHWRQVRRRSAWILRISSHDTQTRPCTERFLTTHVRSPGPAEPSIRFAPQSARTALIRSIPAASRYVPRASGSAGAASEVLTGLMCDPAASTEARAGSERLAALGPPAPRCFRPKRSRILGFASPFRPGRALKPGTRMSPRAATVPPLRGVCVHKL